MFESAKAREAFEDTQKIKPFMERLCRKSPTGEKSISPEWKLAAGVFYEMDCTSDIKKGHHGVSKVKALVLITLVFEQLYWTSFEQESLDSKVRFILGLRDASIPDLHAQFELYLTELATRWHTRLTQ